MKLRLCFAAAVLLPAALASTGFAQPRSGLIAPAIQFYFAPDESTPPLAAEYLRSHPGEGMRLVTIAPPNRTPRSEYYAIATSARSARGVCRFTVTQIFSHATEGAPTTWDRMPPTPTDYVQPPYAMGAAAPALCPRQDDVSYVTLDQDITDAELIEITAFWKDMSSSQAKFDTASDLLPLILSQRIANLFDAFRMRVLTPSDRQPQLRALLRHTGQGYDLGFAEAPGEATSSFLTVAKSVSGYTVMNYQTYLR